jgi:hypothetical protein
VIGAIHPHLLGETVEGVPEDIAARGKKVEPCAFGAINTHYGLREPPKFKSPVTDERGRIAAGMELVTQSLQEFRELFNDFRYKRLHKGTIAAGGTLTVNVTPITIPAARPMAGRHSTSTASFLTTWPMAALKNGI